MYIIYYIIKKQLILKSSNYSIYRKYMLAKFEEVFSQSQLNNRLKVSQCHHFSITLIENIFKSNYSISSKQYHVSNLFFYYSQTLQKWFILIVKLQNPKNLTMISQYSCLTLQLTSKIVTTKILINRMFSLISKFMVMIYRVKLMPCT